MGAVPKNAAERIAWYKARQAVWTASATALGLTTSEMTTMSGYITAADTALTDQTEAKNLAKSATVTLHDAERIMSEYGSDLIKQIRARAGQEGDAVYALAQIPPPATPSPIGAPGTPYQLVVELNPVGSIKLKWRCDSPPGAQGTFYLLGRRAEGSTEVTQLGGTGVRSFTDDTLPAGSSSVIYIIRPARTTVMGTAAEFLVKFGVSTGGFSIASVTPLSKAA